MPEGLEAGFPLQPLLGGSLLKSAFPLPAIQPPLLPKATEELATSACRTNVSGKPRRKAKPMSEKGKLGWLWLYEEDLPVQSK